MAQHTLVMAAVYLALLAAPAVAHAAEASRPWMRQVKVTLGPPVIVAQTGETGLKWGVWQFPTISQPEPNLLLVAFNNNEDRPHNSITELKPAGKYLSHDGGKTWQASDLQQGFTSLYRPTHLCHRRNGDVLYVDASVSREIPKSQLPPPVGVHNATYTVRDPRQMSEDLVPQNDLVLRRAGAGEWQTTPIKIDDPDAGQVSFDPPGKDYAIVSHCGLGQILELPDRSLLAISGGLRLGPDRKPKPKWAVWCLRSIDEGQTWKFQSVIASDDENKPINGYCEPSVDILPDGSILAALRTEGGWEADQRTGILYLAQSYDGGRTWSKPRAVNPFGVFPRVLALKNGITVLSFGRPGVNMLFNVDGRGERWQGLTLLVNEGQRFTRTSGYTSLTPTGLDRFIIAYDQFDYPNAKGEPRKTILVREVVVARQSQEEQGENVRHP